MCVCVFQGVNERVLWVWVGGGGSCRLPSYTFPALLYRGRCSPSEHFHAPPFPIQCLGSYYLSRPTVYFLAQLLCVGVCTANEVNTILRAMMWWLSTIGWQNNLCVFDSGWWIVPGAFGWWDNCFQSSLWSNCASSTQKAAPPSENLLPTTT